MVITSSRNQDMFWALTLITPQHSWRVPQHLPQLFATKYVDMVGFSLLCTQGVAWKQNELWSWNQSSKADQHCRLVLADTVEFVAVPVPSPKPQTCIPQPRIPVSTSGANHMLVTKHHFQSSSFQNISSLKEARTINEADMSAIQIMKRHRRQNWFTIYSKRTALLNLWTHKMLRWWRAASNNPLLVGVIQTFTQSTDLMSSAGTERRVITCFSCKEKLTSSAVSKGHDDTSSWIKPLFTHVRDLRHIHLDRSRWLIVVKLLQVKSSSQLHPWRLILVSE